MQSLPQSPFETNPLHEKTDEVTLPRLDLLLCVLAFIFTSMSLHRSGWAERIHA